MSDVEILNLFDRAFFTIYFVTISKFGFFSVLRKFSIYQFNTLANCGY